jgi:hypothetical protein
METKWLLSQKVIDDLTAALKAGRNLSVQLFELDEQGAISTEGPIYKALAPSGRRINRAAYELSATKAYTLELSVTKTKTGPVDSKWSDDLVDPVGLTAGAFEQMYKTVSAVAAEDGFPLGARPSHLAVGLLDLGMGIDICWMDTLGLLGGNNPWRGMVQLVYVPEWINGECVVFDVQNKRAIRLVRTGKVAAPRFTVKVATEEELRAAMWERRDLDGLRAKVLDLAHDEAGRVREAGTDGADLRNLQSLTELHLKLGGRREKTFVEDVEEAAGRGLVAKALRSALEPYPEARKAVAVALRALEEPN